LPKPKEIRSYETFIFSDYFNEINFDNIADTISDKVSEKFFIKKVKPKKARKGVLR